ncbi:MAG: polyprenyl synthetase family protein [Flavobacteriales bacterium]|nr:polyprenyl synthetase family protein [Flavobacteriales bacterium]
MRSITEYQEIVHREMQRFITTSKDAVLYEPVKYILDLGGKRMRPVLTLMGTDFFDGNLEDSYSSALGIEVFHNFTLLHDDIMDNAPLRRGKATVHEKWNVNSAILSGDVMFVQAFTLVTNCKTEYLRAVIDIFNVTAIEVCEGQQLDLDFENRDDVSLDEYLEMIRLKTSVLVGCALELGAVLANAPKQDSRNLYEFGMNLGMAFQIKDDILDVFGDSALFGKQVGGDILANKKTYLLLKALEDANELQHSELKRWMSNGVNHNSNEKVQAVTAIFEDLNVKEAADKLMNEYYLKAIQSLEKINVSNEKKDYFRGFAAMLMERTY